MDVQPAAPLTPKRPECVLVLSDLHVGSTVGILPKGFQTAEGNEIGLNAIQEFLWAAWQDMCAWAHRTLDAANFVIVINGDCIDGDHHGTKQIWSKDTSDQVKACIELLQPLTYRASKLYIVRGTESHTNNTEASVGAALRAERNPTNGQHAFDRLHLTVHGCRIAVSHHISTSIKSWTNATAYAAVLAEETIQAVNNGEAPRQVICRAHRHKFGSYTNGRGTVIVSPPWQMLTRFGHKVVTEARTQPGAYILDWRGLPEGALPKVHERLYQAPPEPEISL
jgi:predicted MPP superfamily phosphohydrolase